MRQLVAFMEAIRVRTATERYYQQSFFAALHGAEIKSLEEILGIGLDEETSFDPKTAEAFDKLALENWDKSKRERR